MIIGKRMKTKLLLLIAFTVLALGCSKQKGCEFRKWEVIATPLDNKGVVKLISHDDFYIELPFSEGDTITRWFDDSSWNRVIKMAEETGLNVSKYKFKVISIKKHCW